MKVCMIDGSPKNKDSCSRYLIDEIAKLLNSTVEVIVCNAREKACSAESLNSIYGCDAIVFVFPLYVDGIPSHLITFLQQLEEYIKQQPAKSIRVYAVSNCGFFEGKQNKNALEIIENYCDHTGLIWSMGLGIGAGPFICESISMPWNSSIKKPVYQALVAIKDGIENGETQNQYLFATVKMPRIMYVIGGNLGWIMRSKRNKFKIRDLYKR